MYQKTSFVKKMEAGKPSILSNGFVTCANNPDIINLGTAENRLLYDIILPNVQHRTKLTEKDLTYEGGFNTEAIRQHLAELYRDHFGFSEVDSSQFLLSGGVALVIQCLGLAFCEPDDIIMIPAPCYGAFEPDLKMCQAKIEYIDLDNLPPAPPENAKLLILTNPGNPFGHLIPKSTQVVEWALQIPALHVVTDDIYALSNRSPNKYVSIAAQPSSDPLRVHQTYGISKDWAMSGFHTGFFWSRNPEVLRAVSLAHGCYHPSNDVLVTLRHIFGNKELRDLIISENQNRLAAAEDNAIELCRREGIQCIRSDFSLFMMIDLRDFVTSEEEELSVYNELRDVFRVHVLPGRIGFRCKDWGLFRVCFSSNEKHLSEGISRLGKGIRYIREKMRK